ncbi:MAG: hypothetical protein JW956_03010, partial [Calditrichaceae bacterium]|nr:hypothetical protein [Calditrichaceae bacterium]
MSSVQTILTMGAFMLLTFAVFNMNRMLGEADITLAQDRYKLEALSLMNSYMERATNNNFDEASNDTTIVYDPTDPTVCVAPADLNFDAGETTYDDIDDFDDFVGLSPHIEVGRSGVAYSMNFKVEYVDLSGGQYVTSGTQTYNKRMTISICDNYDPPLIYKNNSTGIVKDTLTISFVFSY